MVGGGPGGFSGGVHRKAAALDGEMELVCGAFSSKHEKSIQMGESLCLDSGRVYGSYKEMAGKEAELPEDKRIDLVVSMEEWKPDKEYERLGLEECNFNILGVEVPYVIIPVRPGRDIALLVEVACLNQRLKWLGYHPARDLNKRLIGLMKHEKR